MIKKANAAKLPITVASAEPVVPDLTLESLKAEAAVAATKDLQNRKPWNELTLHPEDHPRAKALNPMLQKVWDARDRTSWIIARVVLYELGMSVPEFCRLGFIDKPVTLHHLLRPISKKSLREGHLDGSIAALLQGWKTIAESNAETTLATVLKEASQKILDAALKREISPTSKLLRSWRFRSHEQFESSWGTKFRAFRKNGAERFLSLSFGELISIAKGAGLIAVDLAGKTLWNHPVTKEARKAFLAEATARGGTGSSCTLVMMLEFAGYATSAENLRGASDLKSAGLTWNAARDLARFEAISPEAAKPILTTLTRRKLLPRKDIRELEAALQDHCSAARDATTFSKSITTELQRLGITNAAIAESLQIPKPKDTTLSPADCVRLSISGLGYQRECPAGVLALLAARSEEHFHDLLTLRRTEIQRELGLRRGTKEPHPLAVERLLWGVDAEQLGIEKSLIENTEWRRRTTRLTPDQERSVLEQVTQIGTSRARGALQKLLTYVQLGSTSQTIERLASGAGGITGISRAGKVSMVRAERFIRGQEIPPLPLFEEILRSCAVEPNQTVLRRWHLDSADYQNLLQASPAARVLAVDILSRFKDVEAFVNSREASPRAGPELRRFLRGVDFSPSEFSFLLESIGILGDSDRHKLLIAIHREKDAVRGAQAWLRELPTATRQEWIRAIRNLADLVRADLRSSAGQIDSENYSLQELLHLKGEPRFSFDFAVSRALEAREPHARTTMQSLAGLNAKEIIALAESSLDHLLQPNHTGSVEAHRAIWNRLSERGFTPKRLAPALVTVLVANGEQAKTGLLTPIERALEARTISPVTPYAVVAALAARDLSHFEELLSLERARLKANTNGRSPDGEIEAQVWGVHPKVLFDMGVAISGEKAVETAKSLGLRMCEQVLHELVADRSLGLSRGLLRSCMFRVGRMGQDFSTYAGVKSTTLFGFMRGERPLDWLRYSKLVESAKISPDGLVKVWWQLDLAEALKQDSRGLTDRQRVGAALRAEGNGQLISLIPRSASRGQVATIRRNLAALESGRYSQPRMDAILEVLKVPPTSPRGIYLQHVFKTGSIKQAVLETLPRPIEGQRQKGLTLSKSAHVAFADLLAREAELEHNLRSPTPNLASCLAFLNYSSSTLLRGDEWPSNKRALDELRVAFPGATREELRLAFKQLSSHSEITPQIARDADARSWEACLTELRRWPMSSFDSVQVFDRALEVLVDGEVVWLEKLGDVLFGINHDSSAAERVEVMNIRYRLGMPVTHPGDIFVPPEAPGGKTKPKKRKLPPPILKT